nr:YbhB/YbcL family Raf kinase inhibitor-like protein [Pantoea bituminis]
MEKCTGSYKKPGSSHRRPTGSKWSGCHTFLGYGIENSRNHFDKGDLTKVNGYTSGTNTKSVQGYSGPCPPVNADIHNYNFTLIATDIPPAMLEKGLTKDAVMLSLKGHVLGSAGLVGQYILPKAGNK